MNYPYPTRGEAVSVGTWSAPGRVNLIGEHTDYNDGFALPFALPLRTVIEARSRDDSRIHADSDGHAACEFELSTQPGEIGGWAAYVAGIAWALRESGLPVGGADLVISSDVPLGAGLSSSHSLECAVGLALTGLVDIEIDRTQLARLVQVAENEYVGAPTGAMDQMASLYGAEDHLVFFDARDMAVELIPCDLSAAGLDLVVIDTHAPHRNTDGEYGARRSTCHDAARRLGVATLRDVGDAEAALAELSDDAEAASRVRHVLTENARVLECVDLLREHRLRDVGPLLTASHISLRDDFEVTVPELDVAVDAALAAGAHGARMTGGGFGGSAIALVERESRPEVEQAVTTAYATAGFSAPTFLAVHPSRGAGQDN
jgi:galactokinase